jgi:beta-phosphoglucomutase family hydrolase
MPPADAGHPPADSFAAVLFDLDGVLTPTADIHTRAWTEMFDEFLVPRGLDPFTDDDYLRYVDGKPRFDGVRSFLASRHVELPDGDPADPPSQDSVAGLGNRKNDLFLEILRRDGIAPYPGSLQFLDHLATLGTKVAVVSSSRNAGEVLEASGLAPRFEVVTDGMVAAAEHIAGKPAPDMFLNAAARLGVGTADAVVIEDAVSGVAAGRAGDFGLVIGVDRGAGADALREHGADIVVDDLAELL